MEWGEQLEEGSGVCRWGQWEEGADGPRFQTSKNVIDDPNHRRNDRKGIVDPHGPELGFVRSLSVSCAGIVSQLSLDTRHLKLRFPA